MELTAGSRAWAHHELTRNRGKAVPADRITGRSVLTLRDQPPPDDVATWDAVVVEALPFDKVDVAVWCDLTEATPGQVYDVHVILKPGDEHLPRRTGRIEVTAP